MACEIGLTGAGRLGYLVFHFLIIRITTKNISNLTYAHLHMEQLLTFYTHIVTLFARNELWFLTTYC